MFELLKKALCLHQWKETGRLVGSDCQFDPRYKEGYRSGIVLYKCSLCSKKKEEPGFWYRRKRLLFEDLLTGSKGGRLE